MAIFMPFKPIPSIKTDFPRSGCKDGKNCHTCQALEFKVALWQNLVQIRINWIVVA